jgi:hypothetical protein
MKDIEAVAELLYELCELESEPSDEPPFMESREKAKARSDMFLAAANFLAQHDVAGGYVDALEERSFFWASHYDA